MRLSPRTTRHAIDGGAPAAGRYLAADDSSRNGTWHNGLRIERVELADGDSFALGMSELRYVEVAEAPTEPVELIAA